MSNCEAVGLKLRIVQKRYTLLHSVQQMRAFTQECKNRGIFPEFVEIAVEKNSRCGILPKNVLEYPLLPKINNGNIGYIFPRAKKQIYLTTKKI